MEFHAPIARALGYEYPDGVAWRMSFERRLLLVWALVWQQAPSSGAFWPRMPAKRREDKGAMHAGPWLKAIQHLRNDDLVFDRIERMSCVGQDSLGPSGLRPLKQAMQSFLISPHGLFSSF